MKKEIIGVIHLPRLPSLNYRIEGDLEQIIESAVVEAKTLESLGYDGVIIENYGDYPFNKRVEDPLTLSFITSIAKSVVDEVSIKVGINILRNSGRESYAIAVATGADFIRVNSLIEVLATDSGIIEPEAPYLKSIRLNYPGIKIYGDILVKHAGSITYSTMFSQQTAKDLSQHSVEHILKDLVDDYVERGGSDALIATGGRTGEKVSIEFLKILKKCSPVPVFVGSGSTAENVKDLLHIADGVIVGSYIKKNGKAGFPLDIDRAKMFINEAKSMI